MSERHRATVEVLNPNQSKSEARVQWWSENDFCNVNIQLEGEGFHGSSTDFFRALGEARRHLERKGYRLLCYRASRNVWPSGMARDMGLGLKAYQLTLGQDGGKIQDIFDAGPDVLPATVDEQTSNFQEWVDSLR